jgi:hypothetical protein
MAGALRRLGLATLILFALVAPAATEPASVADIFRNPSAYRGRLLSVRGTLTNPRPATPGAMAGPAFTVVDLVAGSGYLAVLSVVPPACPIGSTVTVEGRFLTTVQVKQQFYMNVIEASLVSCR